MGGIGGRRRRRARSALLRSIGWRDVWGGPGRRPGIRAVWRSGIRRRMLTGSVRGRRAGFRIGAIAPAHTRRALPVAWIALVGRFVRAWVGRLGLRAAGVGWGISGDGAVAGWGISGDGAGAVVRGVIGRGSPGVAGRREFRIAGVLIREHPPGVVRRCIGRGVPGVVRRWERWDLGPTGARIRSHTCGIVRRRRRRLRAAAVGRITALRLGHGEIRHERLGRRELGVNEPGIVSHGPRYV